MDEKITDRIRIVYDTMPEPEEKKTKKRFQTEEEYMRFKKEMLASIDRKYNGFKKAVQFVEMKPVPDKLGLLILRKVGKLRGFCGTGDDIQGEANGSKNKI